MPVLFDRSGKLGKPGSETNRFWCGEGAKCPWVNGERGKKCGLMHPLPKERQKVKTLFFPYETKYITTIIMIIMMMMTRMSKCSLSMSMLELFSINPRYKKVLPLSQASVEKVEKVTTKNKVEKVTTLNKDMESGQEDWGPKFEEFFGGSDDMIKPRKVII